MNAIKTFFDSPANRSGLAIWLGTVITAALQYGLMHITPPSADLLGIVVGLVQIVRPENSVSVAMLEKAIADVQAAITSKSPAAIGTVVTDAEQLAAGVIDATKT